MVIRASIAPMKGDERPTKIDILSEAPKQMVKAPSFARLSLLLNLISDSSSLNLLLIILNT